jgi:hypothetical protein
MAMTLAKENDNRASIELIETSDVNLTSGQQILKVIIKETVVMLIIVSW